MPAICARRASGTSCSVHVRGSGDISGPLNTSLARVPSTSTLNTRFPRNSATDSCSPAALQHLGEIVAGHVSFGAVVQHLQAGLSSGPGEVGEVHVRRQILRPGGGVRVVGPRDVVLPVAVDAKRELAAPGALDQAPGGVAVVDGDDQSGGKRRAELAG